MSSDLSKVLKVSSAELLASWLKVRARDIPSESKERKRWAQTFISDLKAKVDPALADLVHDAKRIMLLSEARFDWVFSRFRPDYGELGDEDLGGIDRALACMVSDIETFDAIERRITHENFSHQKQRHTKFQSQVGLQPNPTTMLIARFEHEVQELYRNHDGSGLHASMEVDEAATPDGGALHLVTIYLSQLPAPQDEFSSDGALGNRPVRKVTEVHASYEPKTGFVFVTTSRGGFPIRERVASCFARSVLGVDEDPTVVLGERFELFDALDPESLPDVHGLPFDEIALVEAEMQHPEFGSGSVLTLRNAEGIDQGVIKQLVPGDREKPRVLSVTFRISLSEVSSSKPRYARFRLNIDGSTSLKGDVPHEQLIRDRLPKAWRILRTNDD